jgi:shikimate dehydrogenase
MIDGRTELYGIIGNPIRHSLSPMIHNGAFKRLGWNAVYLAFEVKNLEEALRGIRGLGVRGVSVTHPFKTEVIPFLDKVEKLAKKIGAVNTIVHRGGRLIGYNTDCDGALEALEEKMELRWKKVVLLGAGGAARAIGNFLDGPFLCISRSKIHMKNQPEETLKDSLVIVSKGDNPYETTKRVLQIFPLANLKGRKVLIKPNAARLASPGEGVTTQKM